MNLSNLIGFPLETAKVMLGNLAYTLEITGEQMDQATLVVTNAKRQDENIVLTCAWFILNLGG